MNNETIHQIKARKVIQNNQEFLLGVFAMRQVKEFTRYTERLIVGYEEVEEEFVGTNVKRFNPIYNEQIQRKTNPTKIEKIADYLINDPSALFPTNIVIAIPRQVIDSMEEDGNDVTITLSEIVKKELQKPDGDVYLTVIDGQHRIKGIESAIARLKQQISNLNKTLRNYIQSTPK